MFAKIESWLTLGNQYAAATLVYLGLALILGGTLFDAPNVLAVDDTDCSYTVDEYQEGLLVSVTYDGCPGEEFCCGGICVPLGSLCCEDGTFGNPNYCICCCEGCVESETGEPCIGSPLTTIFCDESSSDE